MSARNQDNNSIMKFTSPDGAPADTWYQVVWRETNASDWQYAGKASLYNDKVEGNIHTITVPISKDSVFFGIRSGEMKGHCSAATAPSPELPARRTVVPAAN
jgi:hypothetical protein